MRILTLKTYASGELETDYHNTDGFINFDPISSLKGVALLVTAYGPDSCEEYPLDYASVKLLHKLTEEILNAH